MTRLREARTYDLSQPLDAATPVVRANIPFRMALYTRHGDTVRAGGVSSALELMSLGTHTGTHIDALSHISRDGRLHGGRDATQMAVGGRFRELGAEQIAPFFCRGVLLDFPRLLRLDCLDPSTPIVRQMMDEACAAQGVMVGEGDVVLFRTGWLAKCYGDPEAYFGAETGVPGPDLSVVEWLVDRKVAAVGSDTLAFEWIRPDSRHQELPVHASLLVDHGIYIAEVVHLDDLARDEVWNFLFVAIPLKLMGASGSPIRPFAIVL